MKVYSDRCAHLEIGHYILRAPISGSVRCFCRLRSTRNLDFPSRCFSVHILRLLVSSSHMLDVSRSAFDCEKFAFTCCAGFDSGYHSCVSLRWLLKISTHFHVKVNSGSRVRLSSWARAEGIFEGPVPKRNGPQNEFARVACYTVSEPQPPLSQPQGRPSLPENHTPQTDAPGIVTLIALSNQKTL